MIRKAVHAIAFLALSMGGAAAQTAAVGTITGVRTEAGEVDFKPDHAAAIVVKATAETLLQHVGPGAKDLKGAETIALAGVHAGDRVLVTLAPGSQEARRIVVMPASAIAQRNEADRLDWARRGITGVVAEKKGNQITVRMRSFTGETRGTVSFTGQTTCKRYAPDSVKFSDAKPGSLAEISIGDQLRARGQKSEDGLTVVAEEVVFGSFATKAGSITAVNVEANEIVVKDLATNQPLRIKLTGDSQLKRMPDFPGMPGGAMPGGAMPGGAMPGGRPGMGPGAGGPPDLSQMLERMPTATLQSLKPGETVVVSSTKGAKSGEITAIMLLANAGMLVRMASSQSGNRPDAANVGGPGIGASGMSGGLGGLDLPGMIP